MKKFWFLGVIAVLAASLSCVKKGLLIDDALSALAAGDQTALIRVEGCGTQYQVTEGYAYCRLAAGSSTGLGIDFIAPKMSWNCGREVCTEFKIFYPTGEPAYSDTIPKGQPSKRVLWSTLTRKETFDSGDRGYWPYTYTMYWLDASGREQRTVNEGEIRLRVYNTQSCDAEGKNCKSYEPLREARNDSRFVWKWKEGVQEIKMTTAGRVFVSQIPETQP